MMMDLDVDFHTSTYENACEHDHYDDGGVDDDDDDDDDDESEEDDEE